jgi:hypothetical protein
LSEKIYYRDSGGESSSTPRRKQGFSKAVGLSLVFLALVFSGGTIGGVSPTQSASAATQTTLTIKALDLNGTIHHMWTTIQQNGHTITTGYTPLSFSGIAGQKYTINVSNYNNIVFVHWANGNTNNPRTVTLGTSSWTMTAYYQTGPTITPSTLNVNAKGLDGSTLTMWTVIQQNVLTLQTGFTPMTFTGTVGQTYSVSVSDYQNFVFDHWNSGSRNNLQAITLVSSPTSLFAYYQTGSSPAPTQKVGSITASLSSSFVTVGQSVVMSGTVYDNASNPMSTPTSP